MLTIYTSPSCTSCRKAKQWLLGHKIPFCERNIYQEKMELEELRKILMLTETGTGEIFSTRSETFHRYGKGIEEMNLSQLLKLIQENPRLLRRPILVDDKRLLVGYNEDDIRRFIPRKIRKLEMLDARMRAGL